MVVAAGWRWFWVVRRRGRSSDFDRVLITSSVDPDAVHDEATVAELWSRIEERRQCKRLEARR